MFDQPRQESVKMKWFPNCQIKLVIEGGVHLICACWLANRGLSLKSQWHVNPPLIAQRHNNKQNADKLVHGSQLQRPAGRGRQTDQFPKFLLLTSVLQARAGQNQTLHEESPRQGSQEPSWPFFVNLQVGQPPQVLAFWYVLGPGTESIERLYVDDVRGAGFLIYVLSPGQKAGTGYFIILLLSDSLLLCLCMHADVCGVCCGVCVCVCVCCMCVCVCVCVCVHACMHACMRVCVCMRACVHSSEHACICGLPLQPTEAFLALYYAYPVFLSMKFISSCCPWNWPRLVVHETYPVFLFMKMIKSCYPWDLPSLVVHHGHKQHESVSHDGGLRAPGGHIGGDLLQQEVHCPLATLRLTTKGRV